MGPYVVQVSMLLGPISSLYGSLYMLSAIHWHLVSLLFCLDISLVRVSMSLYLTSVLYGSLCCKRFYVTWSCFHYVRFPLFSEFLYHLVSVPFCICHSVDRGYMSLGRTSVINCSLGCLSFYVTWSPFRYIWVLVLSEYLCHLVLLPFCVCLYVVLHPFCVGLYVVRVSMSLGLTSVMHGSLCCPSFYVTWSYFRSVWVSMLSYFRSV